jgi:hypothetical protein
LHQNRACPFDFFVLEIFMSVEKMKPTLPPNLDVAPPQGPSVG